MSIIHFLTLYIANKTLFDTIYSVRGTGVGTGVGGGVGPLPDMSQHVYETAMFPKLVTSIVY